MVTCPQCGPMLIRFGLMDERVAFGTFSREHVPIFVKNVVEN